MNDCVASLSSSLALVVDDACDDFERHWRRAVRRGEQTPVPEMFLERFPEETRGVLRSLLNDLFHDLTSTSKFPFIPGYDFLAEIARGPMGVVYHVRREGENRDLALKAIQSVFLSPSLNSEGEVLTQLCHPRIVPVESFGEYQGLHYLVMPLIEGGDLRTRRQEFILESKHDDRVKRITRLMTKVTDAVEYLHRRGILHRDLKPSNILLDRCSSDCEPLVCDFGLARRIGESRPAEVIGTLFYMAPEQMEGRMSITTAADIWSLGAMLYELLTGNPPFKREGQLDTAGKLGETEPPSPADLNPSAEGCDLVRVCRRCLLRDPHVRYSSAAALMDDLYCCGKLSA